MATKAYILIETQVGKMRDIAAELNRFPEVETVDAVTGPYDIIAVISAPDLNALGDLVTARVHTIDGILRTVTCLSIGTS
jgi:DNA-binding Lrp family transcriptional regulator